LSRRKSEDHKEGKGIIHYDLRPKKCLSKHQPCHGYTSNHHNVSDVHKQKKLKECAAKYHARLYAFGHLGDGNIHADFAYPKEKSVSDEQLEDMRKEVYETTLELGGAITAEHGVGLSKIRYMEMALSKTELELMKQIKKLFDPQNILNPGKIFVSL